MELKAFKKRILYDRDVLLTISDCALILGVSEEELLKLLDNDPIEIDGIGKCIKEAEFNYILRNFFSDSGAHIQITNYSTLDLEAQNLANLVPLKVMFLADMLKDTDIGVIKEYLEKVEFPKELEKEKEKLKVKYDPKIVIEQYKKNLKRIENMLPKELELQIQTISVINNGKIFFDSFISGVGVFYNIYIDEYAFDDEFWDSAKKVGNNIELPTYNGSKIIERKSKRDFRKFNPIDNIVFCLQNFECDGSEMQDEVSIRYGGVFLFISKEFLVSLVNDKSNKNIFYANGVINLWRR